MNAGVGGTCEKDHSNEWECVVRLARGTVFLRDIQKVPTGNNSFLCVNFKQAS